MEQQGDEHAPSAPVAIEERVDGLELGVHQSGRDQHWQCE